VRHYARHHEIQDNFVDVEQPILLKVEPIDNEPVDYDIYVEPVDIGSEDATSHDPTASSEAENSATIKEEPFDSRESLESG